MSPELHRFLTEWLEWAKGGETSRPFSPCVGLCDNLDVYMAEVFALSGQMNYHPYRELKALLSEVGPGEYPFGREEYYRRQKNGTQHQDPNRLRWVAQQLEKAP